MGVLNVASLFIHRISFPILVAGLITREIYDFVRVFLTSFNLLILTVLVVISIASFVPFKKLRTETVSFDIIVTYCVTCELRSTVPSNA